MSQSKRGGFTYMTKFFIIFPAIFFLIFSIVFYSCSKKGEGGGHHGNVETEGILQKDKGVEHKKKLYHCPMHPNYISDKPGECPICGMTLVPVEEEKTSEEGTIKISPEKQQLTGVTYGRVEYRNLKKVIRTVAKLSYDETNIRYITTKFSGWIEKLYVDYTGKLVKKGEPLFEIYSPELVSAQEEYLLALKFEKITERANSLLNSTRTRLLLWDISENQIKEIEESGKPMRRMVYYSPFSGFVIEKNVFEGKYISAGENLYKIADISNIWVFADIYEFELPFIKMGQEAIITLPYYPGEVFRGKITYIYPSLENETRTVKVRIELKNFEFKLKPEMFGNAEIDIDLGKKLAVPESAVIDTGMRKIVFVNRGNGYIEPREVKLGHRVDEYYEVLEGLSEGEEAVTSANFLIDSESNLKSAIKGMSGEHKHGQ